METSRHHYGDKSTRAALLMFMDSAYPSSTAFQAYWRAPGWNTSYKYALSYATLAGRPLPSVARNPLAAAPSKYLEVPDTE